MQSTADPDLLQKLRPFFPPLAPLQSLNLRAALYRGLTDLKKNGTLGKEVILRKTMLDECKGEKFEEVIRVIAIAVVRREACRRLESASLTTPGYLATLAAPETLTASQRERLIPLVLAYTQSLQRQLAERGRKSERFRDEKRRLDDAQSGLAVKRKAVLAGESQLPSIKPEELESISNYVREIWTGDEQWAETLIHGGAGGMGHQVAEDAQRTLQLSASLEDKLPTSFPTSLLAELNERIERQQSRLRKWAEFRASLEKPQEGENMTKPLKKREPILQFDGHQKLQPSLSRKGSTPSDLHTKQDRTKDIELIQAMRSELANLRTKRNSKESYKVLRVRDEGALKGPKAHDNTKSQLRAPVSTGPLDFAGWENVSDIRSTIHADVLSKHHDIAELNPNSPGSSTETDLERISPIPDPLPLSKPSALSNHPRDHIGLNLSNGNDGHFPPSEPRPAELSSSSSPFQPLHDPDVTPANLPPEVPSVPTHSSTPPPKHNSGRLTLLERTRQSMALLPPPSEPDLPPTLNRSLTNTTTIRSKAQHQRNPAKHPRPSSQLYPVNQFSTPHQKSPTPLNLARRDTAPITDGTPAADTSLLSAHPVIQRFKSTSSPLTSDLLLFSDQADYESVFKSRPRIAVSPVTGSGSPERGGSRFLGGNQEEDGIGENGGGGFSSSPLRDGR